MVISRFLSVLALILLISSVVFGAAPISKEDPIHEWDTLTSDERCKRLQVILLTDKTWENKYGEVYDPVVKYVARVYPDDFIKAVKNVWHQMNTNQRQYVVNRVYFGDLELGIPLLKIVLAHIDTKINNISALDATGDLFIKTLQEKWDVLTNDERMWLVNAASKDSNDDKIIAYIIEKIKSGEVDKVFFNRFYSLKSFFSSSHKEVLYQAGVKRWGNPPMITWSVASCIRQGLIKKAIDEHTDYPVELLDFNPRDYERITSQTKGHLLRNYSLFMLFKRAEGIQDGALRDGTTGTHFLDDDRIAKFLLSIYEKEKALCDKGHYTFIHGRSKRWAFKSDMFKALWNCTHKHVEDDYTFVRFGAESDKYVQRKDRPDALYMNYALFTNFTNKGSYTLGYWYRNHDYSSEADHAKFSLEYIFSYFGLRDYFAKYAKEIDELEHVYQRASPHGEILLLGIDAGHMDYITPDNGAGKVVPMAVGGVLTGQVSTTSAKTLCDALKCNSTVISGLTEDDNRSCDKIEFILRLTPDYALNPQSGIVIKSFYFLDQESKKVYEEKRDALFVRIKADIERDSKMAVSSSSSSHVKSSASAKLVSRL